MELQTEKFNLLSNENAILFVMLLGVIFLIYKTYQTPLTSKSFIINIYLYIMVALLFIAVMGRYTQSLQITDINNTWKMIIVYFIFAFAGISMMISDKFFVNHVGFLLLLLALSLIIGSSYRYANNITQAATITAVIVAVLTMVVFTTTEENLIRMKEWLPNLTWILLCVILIELGYMFLFDGRNETFYRILSISVIILFAFFVLADTSKLIIESKKTPCKTHVCINYPLKSSSLILDYLNIFVNLLNHN